MDKQIDIIIPAFNAEDTIKRTLYSLASQVNIQECVVTIIDDHSDCRYESIVAPFRKDMLVKILRTLENGGPGNSRQYGIDHTFCPYLTFIDADDNFFNCFSLSRLKSALESSKSDMIISKFLEEVPNKLIEHSPNFTWMFGKIYRRSFLEKYNIHFCKENSFSNEDLGFNLQCKFAGANGAKISTLDDNTYIWRYKEDTITRIDNHSYEFNQGLVGYVNNIIYAIETCGKDKVSKELLYQTLLTGLTECYGSYNKSMLSKYNSKYTDSILNVFKILYSQYKDEYNTLIQASDFSALVTKNCFSRNNFIPIVSLYDFFKKVDPEFDVSKIKNIVD